MIPPQIGAVVQLDRDVEPVAERFQPGFPVRFDPCGRHHYEDALYFALFVKPVYILDRDLRFSRTGGLHDQRRVDPALARVAHLLQASLLVRVQRERPRPFDEMRIAERVPRSQICPDAVDRLVPEAKVLEREPECFESHQAQRILLLQLPLIRLKPDDLRMMVTNAVLLDCVGPRARLDHIVHERVPAIAQRQRILFLQKTERVISIGLDEEGNAILRTPLSIASFREFL